MTEITDAAFLGQGDEPPGRLDIDRIHHALVAQLRRQVNDGVAVVENGREGLGLAQVHLVPDYGGIRAGSASVEAVELLASPHEARDNVAAAPPRRSCDKDLSHCSLLGTEKL